MQSLKDQIDIRLFSHLIQTVLCCRLGKQQNINQQVLLTINKLQARDEVDWVDLNVGIQMLSKLHKGSNFYVQQMIQKYILSHDVTKYCIYLEIFTVQNKNQQQQKFGKQDKFKIIERWVFRKQNDKKRNFSITQTSKSQSDLIFQVLTFILGQNQSQNQENSKKMEIKNNSTATKDYELFFKSNCPENRKKLIHIVHLEKIISQLEVHTQSLKSSLLQFANFWEKSLHFHSQNAFYVGCYFYKPFKKQTNNKIENVNSDVLRQPDRKFSQETKVEQKESTCSFKFSLKNFSFRFSGNKKLKKSSDVQPIRKTSVEISNLHRPRYQSIYESKDEEMNIFILSPRKLWQQQSPKIKHLEQKPLQLEIYKHKGIREEVIEQFAVGPDELMSSESSEGFETLEENDQLQIINEEKPIKAFEKAQKQAARRKKQILFLINYIQNELIVHLRSVDNGWLLSV